MLWALWLELRHAKALPGSLVAVPIGLFVGYGALWSGTYIWENRTYALVVSLTLVGPVLAAFAAWDGSRLRSAGLGIQWRLARDRGSRAVLTLLVSNLVLGALVYGTVGVGLFLPFGVPGVPSGGPIWAWLAVVHRRPIRNDRARTTDRDGNPFFLDGPSGRNRRVRGKRPHSDSRPGDRAQRCRADVRVPAADGAVLHSERDFVRATRHLVLVCAHRCDRACRHGRGAAGNRLLAVRGRRHCGRGRQRELRRA